MHTILSYSHFHLTGRKESALLIADETAICMIKLWLKVLAQVHPDCELAFPDFQGQRPQHIERRVDSAAKILGHSLLTATSLRKVIEIFNKRLEGPSREAVSRALSHSLNTAQRYYQAPTLRDAYSAYEMMQGIMGGTQAVSLPPVVKGKGKRPAKAHDTDTDDDERKGKRPAKAHDTEIDDDERKGKRPAKAHNTEKDDYYERKGKRPAKAHDTETDDD